MDLQDHDSMTFPDTSTSILQQSTRQSQNQLVDITKPNHDNGIITYANSVLQYLSF